MRTLRPYIFGILIAVLTLAPIPANGEPGAYNMASRLAYCQSEKVCLHEIGHALDHQAGWISQGVEFYKALELYIYIEAHKAEVTEQSAKVLELTYRSNISMQNVKMEIYAYLFQWSNGNENQMPELFRSFYDWQAANRMIEGLDGSRIYRFK